MSRLPASAIGMLDLLVVPVGLLAAAWVWWRQAQIMRSGVALDREQLKLAEALGVQSAQRVRVVVATPVPLPLPGVVRDIAQRAGWISAHIAGMTLGYGIVLRGDCSADRRLLAHELAHVAQYERLGLRSFLRQYLRECLWSGYPYGALEIEAQAAEAKGSMPE
jgi:hypothetical protein